ncbi:hypothetical protein BGZ70_005621 [Mortierella alpina]|uniref:Uncharacterized protein n=1 Tax=Mortierella alpina TaxID=64518 RepID=A0A9P6JF10_MORAP|nr:hypothetical protein BGZ70_005621 [Mortierella alpina]
MPSSPTHNIVRALQLALSISIVATAAFLLHYRTQSHSNFTNEPLVSCISGGVAFIYALWALLNHRRQPDNHRWKYLHGLGCLVVAGLLIAGSVLAFVLGNRGVLCQQLDDADNIKNTGIVQKRDLPEYDDGRQYGPQERCENFYAEMDKANAVMGIVAAIVWMVDFGLIFGLCGSSGRYGPHRDYPARRGQIAPEDEDYFPAGEGSRRTDDFYPQEDYYDTLDQRKMALDWLEQKNRAGTRSMDDPRSHIQEPIPLAMRQNLGVGGASSNKSELPFEASENSTKYHSGATSATTLNSDQHHVETGQAESPAGTVVTVLSPPPLPRPRWVQPPDSPTLPAPKRLQDPQLSFSSDRVSLTEGEPTLPAESTPQAVQQPLEQSTMSEPESDLQFASAASSPRYVEFPPGPACYVFESSHQEFLPSYVNMAARFEQKQTLKQSSPASSAPSSTASGAGTPTGKRSSSQRRIVVTGLGFDVSSRDEAEIAAEEAKEAEQGKSRGTAEADSTAVRSCAKGPPEQGGKLVRDSTDALATASLASGDATLERPQNVKSPIAKTPLSAPPMSPMSPHVSTSPASVPVPSAEPLSGPQSFGNKDSRHCHNAVVSNATSTHSSPRASTASTGSNSSGTSAINKKPAMTKRKTSKLSVVTLKNGLQNINSYGISSSGNGNGNGSSCNALDSAGTGLNSTATSAVGTPSAELSPAMRNMTLSGGTSPLQSASPRSPYRGDF